MSGSEISKLEQELSMIQRLVESDEANLVASDSPLVEKIFLASSSKLLHDVQRKLHEANSERAHELVRLRLIGSQMDGSIQLRTLTKLMHPLSQMLEYCSWRIWDKDGDHTKIDDRFSSLLDLRLSGIATGSTELAITGNTSPDLTGVSALQGGLRNIFSLLSANNEDASDYIDEIGFSAARAMTAFMAELEKNSLAIEMQWNAPGEGLYWNGRPSEISRINSILEDIGEPISETLNIRGAVQVLSVRNRVEILISEQEPPVKIVATYHHSMMEDIQDLRLGDRRDFEIERTIYPFSRSKKKKSAYRLKAIRFVDFSKKPDEI